MVFKSPSVKYLRKNRAIIDYVLLLPSAACTATAEPAAAAAEPPSAAKASTSTESSPSAAEKAAQKHAADKPARARRDTDLHRASAGKKWKR